MKFLIVNADDFGMTGGINKAVIQAHTRGILTSTTIMTNMPAFDDAVRLAKSNPNLGVGLHFNITQDRPVAEASTVRSLLNGRGEFLGTSTALLRRSLTGKLNIKEVELELRAQIEKGISAGLRITHVDSHKHSHALPQICSAIAETIGDYGIRAVRLPRERQQIFGWPTSGKWLAQAVMAFGLAQLCRASESKLRKAAVKTTDAFFGIAQTGLWTKRWLIALIESLPDGVSELMSHPGYQDRDLEQIGTRLQESRQNELQLLLDQDVIETVRRNGIRLINYAQLDDIPPPENPRSS